jgi:predicted nucleic acid-binding protein
MPIAAYFDSMLWLAILADEATAGDVTTLAQEIKSEKGGRVLTSIMTLTEISVRAYRDEPARVQEGIELVSSVAAICSVSREIALLTAEIEARFMTTVWSGADGSRKRRWDALHLATAVAYDADVFFTYDRGLLEGDFTAESRIPPVRRPQPLQGSLSLPPNRKIVL